MKVILARPEAQPAGSGHTGAQSEQMAGYRGKPPHGSNAEHERSASTQTCGVLLSKLHLEAGSLTTALDPDSPDALGQQDRRPQKRWRNCRFLLSPVGSVRI